MLWSDKLNKLVQKSTFFAQRSFETQRWIPSISDYSFIIRFVNFCKALLVMCYYNSITFNSNAVLMLNSYLKYVLFCM